MSQAEKKKKADKKEIRKQEDQGQWAYSCEQKKEGLHRKTRGNLDVTGRKLVKGKRTS